MSMTKNFWLEKSLSEMNDEEWEALCDGCGKCCFHSYYHGRGKREKLYRTRIACNLLDLNSGKCRHYTERFRLEPECTKLTKKNLPSFSWLPQSCAYRLLYEGKTLPEWHPLISGDPHSVQKAGIPIANGVYASEVIDWFEFVIDNE